MNQFAKMSLMFMLPLVVVYALAEWQMRQVESGSWFDGLAQYCDSKRFDFLFVGTSITATAVDADQFASQVSLAKGQPAKSLVALNVGAGYSTPAEYYFGLRRLIARHADALRGATVLIECPGGIPVADTWNDRWVNVKRPQLLAAYLTPADLLDYFQRSAGNFSEKAFVAVSFVSAAFAEAPALRHGIMDSINGMIESVLPQSSGHYKPAAILARGGVRVDEVAMSIVRNWVLAESVRLAADQKPINWNSTIMKDIVQFAQQHGAQVAFYEVPVSSYLMRPLETATRQSDKDNFVATARSWHCAVLSPKVPHYADVDFPDLLHIARWRTPEYTSALATSYLASLRDR